jgi:thymidylate synthase ThyX
MSYAVQIFADSVSPTGKRITTFELTYPRFVHAELMTHRLFSRNSASSRAIPVEKMLARIETDPAIPIYWGKNQKGMAAETELDDNAKREARDVWLAARDTAVHYARELIKLDLHKQIANRITEPWMFITVLVTTTELDNWFNLRRNPMAQPEIKWVADAMWNTFTGCTPVPLVAGEWHLPLVDQDEREQLSIENLKKISTGRCARVSYLTHEGKRDINEDIALHDRLLTSGHWSPFEHVAQALDRDIRTGNFIGWRQYRKSFETEHPGQIEVEAAPGDMVLSPEEMRAFAWCVLGASPDAYSEFGSKYFATKEAFQVFCKKVERLREIQRQEML